MLDMSDGVFSMLHARWVLYAVLLTVIKLLSGEEAEVTDHGEVVLTPWWTLRFSEGESMSIDCGVSTNGQPEHVTMSWVKGNNTIRNSEYPANNR